MTLQYKMLAKLEKKNTDWRKKKKNESLWSMLQSTKYVERK